MEKPTLQNLINENLPDWILIVDDAKRVNAGAYAHDVNKNRYKLEDIIEIMKSKIDSITVEQFNSAVRSAQILTYKLYLLSKGK